MKIQRPGNTESHLLIQNFLKTHHPKQYNIHIEYCFIKWLYSTSGFYDKKISVKNIDSIINSDCYQKWIIEYEKSLYDCDHIECYIDPTPKCMKQYLLKFNPKSLTINYEYVKKSHIPWHRYWCLEGKSDDNNYNGVFSQYYNLLKDKKVLIISAFSELIEYQYKHNVHNIFKNFPKFDLLTLTTPYTFLNDGPHNNFFETLDTIYDQVSDLDFDISLLSCGTYAALLIDKIHSIKKKDAIYMGRGCSYMFGIDPNRDPAIFKNWITTIPTKYIPLDYNKIEDGIYWVKNTNDKQN